MILIPALLLAAFPPGILFPDMAVRMNEDARRSFAWALKKNAAEQHSSSPNPGDESAEGENVQMQTVEKVDGGEEKEVKV